MKYEVQPDFSGFTVQWDLKQPHCLRSVSKWHFRYPLELV